MATTILTWLLRLAGVMLSLALVAVFLPRGMVVSTNAWLALAPLPNLPLTFYLARSTSLLYAAHGAILLLASTDLVRYRPLIALLGASNLVIGSALLGIDVTSGMPWWWTLAEGPSVIASGVAILVLIRHIAVSDTTTHSRRHLDGPAISASKLREHPDQF